MTVNKNVHTFARPLIISAKIQCPEQYEYQNLEEGIFDFYQPGSMNESSKFVSQYLLSGAAFSLMLGLPIPRKKNLLLGRVALKKRSKSFSL